MGKVGGDTALETFAELGAHAFDDVAATGEILEAEHLVLVPTKLGFVAVQHLREQDVLPSRAQCRQLVAGFFESYVGVVARLLGHVEGNRR